LSKGQRDVQRCGGREQRTPRGGMTETEKKEKSFVSREPKAVKKTTANKKSEA